MALEIFNSFGDTIKTLRLTPGEKGEFTLLADGKVLFAKKAVGPAEGMQAEGRFPEVKEVFEALNRHLEMAERKG